MLETVFQDLLKSDLAVIVAFNTILLTTGDSTWGTRAPKERYTELNSETDHVREIHDGHRRQEQDIDKTITDKTGHILCNVITL